MEFSKHNIISRLTDSDDYFILNLLSQQADIFSAEQYKQLITGKYPDQEELIGKGYLVEPDAEKRLFRDRYLKFIDNRDSDEIQLFFVPTYTCNFACTYCYQNEYESVGKMMGAKEIRAFYRYIELQFAHRKKYVTLFGGEPLQNTDKYRQLLWMFIQEANARKLDIAIVTNGYHLASFIELLKKASIREIQVTLDGIDRVHDARRPLKSGKGTFDHIVTGIDSALDNNLPVNLRMVLDKQNISELPRLAAFSISKGWTKNPLFKTQIGRNYELHHCQKNNDRLYDRIEIYREIYLLIRKHPEILEFYRPAYSVSKTLIENGELPDPLFDSCPATKTEWAFDFTGKIYPCTATVGKKGEELGTFYPEVSLDTNKVAEWEERDILSIAECRECSVQLACGGGCGAIAKNRSGKLCSSDCRPIKELLEMGLSLYQKENP